MIFVCRLSEKHKNIKKVKKILLIFLTVVISIPTAVFFAINSERIQNIVAHRVTEMLSEELGNHISFDNIRVSWFNKVTLHDLCVTDLRGDTVLFTPELIGRLNLLAFSSHNIEVRKAVLNRADVRFAIDPERDEINIKFIIDKLKSNDTTTNKARWIFGMQSVELNDCKFSFKNVAKPFDRPFGMDYADIEVSDLNLIVSDFRVVKENDAGGVAFRIRKLACVEKCGLKVDFLSADFLVNRNNLSFKNVHAVTSASELKAEDASFSFDSFQDFGEGGFISKVTMSMDVTSSKVACGDLTHFVPFFADYSDTLSVKGKATGTIENLKGEGIAVSFGKMTRINCNLDLKGLPRLRSTLIYADVADLQTCPADIEHIQIPGSRTGHVNLPATMHQLSTIGFKGKFTGFFDDFVTFGTFTTNLGNLSTDVSIKPVTGSDIDTTFTFHGELKTEQFHLGKLLTQPSIGRITMSGLVDGSASGRGNIHAMIEGRIGSIGLRGYEYRNISVNGTVNNRMYDGQLSIAEPNIKMDFSGKVDLTNSIPAYDFWANVERARLHDLKLVENDTSSFAAFSIKAVFSGTNIDNLAGELELKNSLFRRNSREIEINDLQLFTKTIRDTNRFILLSDILDAEIWGQYQFLKLPESFFSLVKNYSPAWVPAVVSPDSLSHNNFRFEAEFKNTEKITNFFVNEFRISRNTRLEGIYNPSQRDVKFTLNVPYMNLNGHQGRGLYLTGSVEDSVFIVESGGRSFTLKNEMEFANPTLIARAHGDSMMLDVRWNNWDTVLNKGSLSSKIFFVKAPGRTAPSIRVFSSPGQIVTSGDVWALTHRGIAIDSSTIVVNNLRATMGKQEILVSGIVSRNEEDKLLVKVKDLNLPVVNSSLQFDKLRFGGIANGTASLSNLYRVPVFIADLHVEDFSLNESMFGRTDISASWNGFNRSVRIETESILNDLRTLSIKGNYHVADRALNFDVAVEKVPLKILQPYIENVFTDTEGMASGQFKLGGHINKPLLNGNIEMQRAALTLDYTKTRYSFSGNAVVQNNTIQFKDTEIYDRFGNLCKTTGSISLGDFKEIAFDLRLNANNLEVLNTRERDNSLFYGKAFATGNIHVAGVPKDIRLNIAARTEKNTQFNIPLSSNDEISKTSFISFLDRTPRSQRRASDFRRRRTAQTAPEEPVREQKFTINIAMDITPDAEAQLIFDSKIGDIMRARGTGNLRLNIGNNKFDMFGTYAVEEGDYLFTLKNIINKKFIIDKGGVITWNGDPLGALVNLKAMYMAKPSLYDLMNDESYRRSIPVECVLHITNRLTNPNLRFELSAPNADQVTRSFLSAATATEESMTRQFLSLLVMNQFYPDMNTEAGGSSGSGLETMGLATASEFLTSQLGHMLSNNNFGVDFSYHPGTEMTGQNFGMGFNTDSWSFHMDYEVGGARAEETSTNVVGDFTFDAKLSKSGKLRFKAFNRANDYQYSQAPYTQGIGLLYREDFNTLKDIFKRKKSPAVAPKKEDEPTDEENNSKPPQGESDKPATAAVTDVSPTNEH